ncbi:hypothetical protein [Pseudalkalibacillus hwajinpoensis]|uniref:Uncharacterized protein n=1 Tax=Guptibacillus hwajinpoensis TaxID=208199 RepID=A0A4U1MK57_9BACL|nr:hypothetical protein [Pseudalkalibacillus hwajinpoensis]TKD71237.1 hypothetical protein FBF83_00020 [Pseudalkalibacillus hwajinpoensis]
MNNRGVGILLIGFSLLTGVITYSVGELVIAIKQSAAHVSASISGANGPAIGWGGNPLLSQMPVLTIASSIILGLILIKRN